MVFNSYATGSKVYRSGSSAPTMGTVDPMGYIERGMRQKMTANLARRFGLPPGGAPLVNPARAGMGGTVAPAPHNSQYADAANRLLGDNASGSRSGLAAAALRRQEGQPTGTPKIHINIGTGAPGPDIGGRVKQNMPELASEMGSLDKLAQNNAAVRNFIQQHYQNYDPNADPTKQVGAFYKDLGNPQGYLERHNFGGLQDLINNAQQSGTPMQAFQQGLQNQAAGLPQAQQDALHQMNTWGQQNMGLFQDINHQALAELLRRRSR